MLSRLQPIADFLASEGIMYQCEPNNGAISATVGYRMFWPMRFTAWINSDLNVVEFEFCLEYLVPEKNRARAAPILLDASCALEPGRFHLDMCTGEVAYWRLCGAVATPLAAERAMAASLNTIKEFMTTYFKTLVDDTGHGDGHGA